MPALCRRAKMTMAAHMTTYPSRYRASASPDTPSWALMIQAISPAAISPHRCPPGPTLGSRVGSAGYRARHRGRGQCDGGIEHRLGIGRQHQVGGRGQGRPAARPTRAGRPGRPSQPRARREMRPPTRWLRPWVPSYGAVFAGAVTHHGPFVRGASHRGSPRVRRSCAFARAFAWASARAFTRASARAFAWASARRSVDRLPSRPSGGTPRPSR